MDEQQAADVLRNLDLRTRRMEQILPDLPTRDEMRAAIDDAITAAVAPLATKADLAALATKAELAPLATKAELAPLATKAELAAAIAPLATKAELAAAIAPLATKAELAAAIAPLATRAELGELSDELHDTRDELRRHMDVWAERIHDEVKLVAESQLALDARDARQHREVIDQIHRLSETTARQHADVMQELRGLSKTTARQHADLDARLRKVEGKPPRKRRAS